MRARHALPALFAVSALILTGCADNSKDDASGPAGKSAAVDVKKDNVVAALLPAKVAKTGKLVIATSPNYKPNEYKDSAGKPIGWDIELGKAIAAKLGLKPEFQVAGFDTIVPGVVNGKIDMGTSSFTDSAKREKQVDFVNYYLAGILWGAPAGKVVDPNNACGLRVAVQATTIEDTEEVPAKSAACFKAGKTAIKKLGFDTQEAAANAVALGRADAFTADTPVSLSAIRLMKGKVQAAGKTFNATPYGMAVAKSSGMAEAVRAALQSLVDDGSYAKILNKWGVAEGGLKTITINAGGQG